MHVKAFTGPQLTDTIAPANKRVAPTTFWLVVALSFAGVFGAIYHPVGTPMLVAITGARGRALGWNGVFGNLGVAMAAVTTGAIAQAFGWRWAFVLPGIVCIALGLAYLAIVPVGAGDYQNIVKDLKFVFPLFVEDFIHHIYEEEDNLFAYVELLRRVLNSNYNPSQLFYEMEKYSIQQHAIEHDVHDDEMKGIRNITNDYSISAEAPLHIKVIYWVLSLYLR